MFILLSVLSLFFLIRCPPTFPPVYYIFIVIWSVIYHPIQYSTMGNIVSRLPLTYINLFLVVLDVSELSLSLSNTSVLMCTYQLFSKLPRHTVTALESQEVILFWHTAHLLTMHPDLEAKKGQGPFRFTIYKAIHSCCAWDQPGMSDFIFFPESKHSCRALNSRGINTSWYHPLLSCLCPPMWWTM